MYPHQAAARPPHYLLPPPSRRQSEAPVPSRNPQNWRDTIDKQGSKGTPIVERRGSIVPGLHCAPCPLPLVPFRR